MLQSYQLSKQSGCTALAVGYVYITMRLRQRVARVRLRRLIVVQ